MAIAILTGLLSSGSTWDTGVMPVAPEVSVIATGVVVTQNVPWDIGDGVAQSITIDAGGELITNALVEYRGNITLDGTLTNDDGSDLVSTAGSWTITQSGGSTWRRVGLGIKPVFRASAGNHWLWRDSVNNASITTLIDGMRCFECGTATVFGFLQRGKGQPALNIIMRNVLWMSCGRIVFGYGVQHHAEAICKLDTHVIINTKDEQAGIVYGSSFPANWTAGNRYLKAYIAGVTPQGSLATVLVDRQNATGNPAFNVEVVAIDSRVRLFNGGNTTISGALTFDNYTGASAEVQLRQNGRGDLLDNVMIYAGRANARVTSAFNGTDLAPISATNCLIEFGAPGGEFLQHYNGGLIARDNIVIDGVVVAGNGSTLTGQLINEHNTQILSAASVSQLSIEYNGAAGVAAYTLEGQSNLRVDYGAVPTGEFASAVQTLDAASSTLDYNNHHVVNGPNAPFNAYSNITLTGAAWPAAGFGASDLYVDPQFQHPPRRIGDFNGEGDALIVFREAFKACGYDVNGNPVTPDPAYVDGWRGVKEWVQAAYVPTNPALQGAAHDGGDIGAYPVLITAQMLTPSSITTTLNLGPPAVIPSEITIQPATLLSTWAAGNANITTGQVTLSPGGIATAAAFGNAIMQSGTIIIVPAGMPSTSIINGGAVIQGAIIITPQGVGSTLNIGDPQITTLLATLYPNGIASAALFGGVIIIGGTQFIDQLIARVIAYPEIGGEVGTWH